MNNKTINVIRSGDSIEIDWGSGSRSRLPNLWLRDNCSCGECRIEQTGEKRFIVSDVAADLVPAELEFCDDTLSVTWPDGHRTFYAGEALRQHADRDHKWSAWPATFVPTRYPLHAFVHDDRLAAAALEEFVDLGAVILSEAGSLPGTLEQLATRLGPIRELLFARIHDVRVDPAGYNIAHTALPLPPHNDFASYSWPPSVQALHMLVNETPGGETVLVDGWMALEALRDEHPDHFEILCTTPVPFREFDDCTETFAEAPLVRCNPDGAITGIRFSNQLMQTMDPTPTRTADFYRAYHALCQRLTDPQARITFRLDGGEILVVAAHRVLHGREAFEPSGKRHLQDAYFEFDNVRNHLFVLQHGSKR